MSRSRRRTPILAPATAASEKRDKVRAHRAERSSVRSALACDGEMPSAKSFGDPWNTAKDGKSYSADPLPGLMRK